MSFHLHLGHAFRSFGNKAHHAFDELENDLQKVLVDHGQEALHGLGSGAEAALHHAPDLLKGVMETIAGNPAGITDAIEAAIAATKEVVEKETP